MADVKQKINDLILILKNDRRIRLVAISIVVISVFMLLIQGPARRPAPPEKVGSARPKDNEAANDLVTAFEANLKSLQKENDTLKAESNLVKRNLEESLSKTSGILEILTEKAESFERKLQQIEENQNKVVAAPTPTAPTEPVEEAGVESFGDTDRTDIPLPPPPPPSPLMMKFIAPGDSVSVKLLTGVHAPVDGTPYPSVFKLSGPIEGPDGASLDLGEARLIAAATGSEIDGRVLYRLTNLAIRQPDGRRTVVKVDGWIVGEDGIRGMEGKLIDKLGKAIAAIASISFLSALGDSLVDAADNSLDDDDLEGLTINADSVNFATATAMNNASNLLGAVLVKRYEKLIPVVEVLSGREVAAVFSQPAEISVCDEEECSADGILASYGLD